MTTDVRPTTAIDRNEWSRVIEAAQDPQQRDAVQRFLAQAELSAEVPRALDATVLAPRRADGATGEQCAYVLCNLGFASLVAGTKSAAEFAMACGRLAEELGPDTSDLALRRLFLAAKGELVTAAITDQPQYHWDSVAGRCCAYLREIDRHLDTLPPAAVESNAMAAYSFAGQCLARVDNAGAVEYYADAIAELVATSLRLASRLPETFASRMWHNLIPGTDAGMLFRQIGAIAERSLQSGDDSTAHATTGLEYVDGILEQDAKLSVADAERTLHLRAELLLRSGRHDEALEQAEALEKTSDLSVRSNAVAIIARCKGESGDPKAAAGCLVQAAPTSEQASETWRSTMIGDTSDGQWTGKGDALPTPRDLLRIWRLQAVAAADLQDVEGFLEAANRCAGFFIDSLMTERLAWVDRIHEATGDRDVSANRPVGKPDVDTVSPTVALDEILAQLGDRTALLQVVETERGLLTWVARMCDGEVSQYIAPNRPAGERLTELRRSWVRARPDPLRDAARNATEVADVFSRLMDELQRNWGELLQGLVEDEVTRLILVGDDLAELPLHATRTGTGNQYLIDLMQVSYVPSLSVLRACLARDRADAPERSGAGLCSLVDPDSDPAHAAALAAILGTIPCELLPPVSGSFWTDAATAKVLHMIVGASYNVRRPFESLLGPGWLDATFGLLVAELALARCEVVLNLHCQSPVPSPLRAPGFDLAALLLAAGAGSVLASTWATDDELASEFAQVFFARWVDGDPPSAAFQEALLRLRAKRPAVADFHWAGMRLVGAP